VRRALRPHLRLLRRAAAPQREPGGRGQLPVDLHQPGLPGAVRRRARGRGSCGGRRTAAPPSTPPPTPRSASPASTPSCPGCSPRASC